MRKIPKRTVNLFDDRSYHDEPVAVFARNHKVLVRGAGIRGRDIALDLTADAASVLADRILRAAALARLPPPTPKVVFYGSASTIDRDPYCTRFGIVVDESAHEDNLDPDSRSAPSAYRTHAREQRGERVMRAVDLICTAPCPGCGTYETRAADQYGESDTEPLNFYCVKSCGWRLPPPENRTVIETQYWTRAYVESCQMRGIKPDPQVIRTGKGISTMTPAQSKPVAPSTFPAALAGRHRTETKSIGPRR
jgi:hypothetical protein